ncbi:SWF/SNF helicase family protein, partial [Candidatus Azambacteria bacterium]|nr:SWF/SNF helicase family protein [Candidatus Azambacteria bacterium]
EKKVFLISLKAGGVGLNLTAADYCIILDPWWNPAVENQAIARTHRIGQTKNVFVYKFIIKNSIEEKVLHLQEKKKRLFENILEEGETFGSLITENDIRNLLE